MRIMLRHGLHLVAFAVVLGGRQLSAEDLSAEHLLDLWVAGCQSIWSYDVDVVTTHWVKPKDDGPELKFVGKFTKRQRYLNGQWRIDHLEQVTEKVERWTPEDGDVFAIAWDGKDARTFSARSNIGEVLPILKLGTGKALGSRYCELYRSTFFGQTYTDMIRPRSGVSLSEASPGVYLLDVPPAPGLKVSLPKSRFVFTLDGTKSFLPSQIKMYSPSNLEAPSAISETDLQEVAAGLWAPVKSQKRIYRTPVPKDSPGELIAIERFEIDLNKATFNVDIDPEVFRLAFPPGTIVYDHNEGKNFVVSANSGRDYEAYAQVVTDMARKRQLAHVARERMPYRYWLVLSGLALIALLGVSGIWRWRARQANPK